MERDAMTTDERVPEGLVFGEASSDITRELIWKLILRGTAERRQREAEPPHRDRTHQSATDITTHHQCSVDRPNHPCWVH